MRLSVRLVLSLLSLTFALTVHAQDVNAPKSVMDMIPHESLAYVSLSDLDTLYHSIIELPEWQELLGIEHIKEDLEKANQAIQFLPMLLGISVDEFLNAFGHKMVLTLIGMKENMPVAGLIVDVRSHREQAEYAAEQAATIPALAGGAMIEEKEYRDVPYTLVGNKTIKISYGFLGNFLLAGIGGGFEKLVDFYKDGGESIESSPNFQFMSQKASPSGNIYAYADLERAAPILEHILGMDSGDSDSRVAEGEEGGADAGQMIVRIILKSAKAFALSLNLSGQAHEVYLHLTAEEPNPITDLVLAPYSPMLSAELVPFANGIMMGIHLGDPTELLDKSVKLMQFLGAGADELKDGMKQVESALKLDLREDLLSAITGEFAVMAMLPDEPINTESKMQMFMQLAKTRQAVLIGVKDEEELTKTAGKLFELAKVETTPLKEQTYKGAKIHTRVAPLDTLVPGVAIMPAYTFRNSLLIMSSSADWVRDTIDLFESSRPTDLGSAPAYAGGARNVDEELSDSRVLLYLDAGGIAATASEVIAKGFEKKMELPEHMWDKLSSLGSIAASLSWGPDGLGIKLISASDDNWATKIFRGVLVAIYANAPSEEEGEAALPDLGSAPAYAGGARKADEDKEESK